MKDNLIRKGDRGEEVRDLQQKLVQLGYSIDIDGDFGPNTDKAVRELQTMFGYDVDGIVGPGTQFLINQQIGYGWNKNAPDAKQKAMQAQQSGKGAQAMQQGDGDGQKWGKQQQPQAQPQKGGMASMPQTDEKAAPNKGQGPGKKF